MTSLATLDNNLGTKRLAESHPEIAAGAGSAFLAYVMGALRGGRVQPEAQCSDDL
jgi:hypothetical protein